MGQKWRAMIGHPRIVPITVRVFADAAMLSVALVLGAAADIIWRKLTGRSVLPLGAAEYVTSYLLMIVSGIVIFALFGFYTRGRAYASRYKVLIVCEAVVVTFLVYAAMGYAFKAHVTFPTPVALLIAGALALVMLVLSRAWSALWNRMRVMESDVPLPGDSEADTVLLIGGAGYIGSALLPRLVRGGHKVRVLDICMFGQEAIAAPLRDGAVELVRADFRQVDQVVRAMRGVHSVIHLGGLVGDPASAVDAELTLEVNLLATQVIAQAAKAHGVRRFIFASTCSVYGASDQTLDERSTLNPVSLYAKSKIASERVLQSLADESFQPTILRFGTVYGQSGRTRFDLVVNLLCAKAVMDKRITIFGADQWRPFVHVADVARAVQLALESRAEVCAGHVYNVGSNEQNMTLGQLGERIRERVPDAELVVSGTDGDRRNYRVSFDKIRRELGFTPTWTIERGIDQVVTAVEEGSVTDYAADRYSNVKVLQDLLGRHEVSTLRESYLLWLESNLGFEEQDAPPSGALGT